MTNCMQCGADRWALVRRLGAVETRRCEACGAEETRHVNFAAPIVPLTRETLYEVCVRWRGELEARHVKELQIIFPELRKVSTLRLFKDAREARVVSVGQVTARELVIASPRLASLGLDLEMTEIK